MGPQYIKATCVYCKTNSITLRVGRTNAQTQCKNCRRYFIYECSSTLQTDINGMSIFVVNMQEVSKRISKYSH